MNFRTFLFALPISIALAAGGCSGDRATDVKPHKTATKKGPDAKGKQARKGGKKGKRGKKGKGNKGNKGKKPPLQRICKHATCTPEQRATLKSMIDKVDATNKRAIAAMKAPAPAGADSPETAANAALAAAFRGEALTPEALLAHHEAMKSAHTQDASVGPWLASRDALALALHSTLNPEQRAALVDHDFGVILRYARPADMGGHGQQRGTGHSAADIETFCGHVQCTDEQRASLTSMIEAKQAELKAMADAAKANAAAQQGAAKAANDALRAKYRSDALTQADLDAFHAKILAARAPADMATRMQAHTEMIIEVHGMLTPEQRERAAVVIEAEGMHALMGANNKPGGMRGAKGVGAHEGMRFSAGGHGPAPTTAPPSAPPSPSGPPAPSTAPPPAPSH
ncbi:MAG: Spy/CpxP family protein refolding chaperone [Myxococcales bacterium]|nr:Spy/CpxP family protein refolding chaperone [Myxococcales bacterium]